MATASSSALFSPCSFPSRKESHRRALNPRASSSPISLKKDVVVVGAGIAGLATALSLHRLGVRSLVLEQGDSLRTGGTSLTLFKNGWRVLDAIGVGDELRNKFLQIEGLVMRSVDGKELRSFSFEEEAPGQEVRAVERSLLLETLSSRLPPNSITFSSKVKAIKKQGTGGTLLELEDGTQILAKIVIGCDGIRSPVAKWMRFSDPRYVGHCAFRGLGLYPEGQPFQAKVNYIYGRGVRAGFVPVSQTKVYWFICFNCPSLGQPVGPRVKRDPQGLRLGEAARWRSLGPRTEDTSILKKEALELVTSWSPELLDVMHNTPDDLVIKTPLVDRWLWPGLSPPASAGKVVVAGDAWHPMTPNLGQGACCALEDSVVLAGKLAAALNSGESVEAAFTAYSQERWARIFMITLRANLVGSLLQWDNPVVCSFRNNVVIPWFVRLAPFLEHTNFECELREPVTSS